MITDRLKTNLEYGKHVIVDQDRLELTCDLMKKKKLSKIVKPYTWKDPLFWLEESKGKAQVSQFFCLGNAINFRYWRVDANRRMEYCEGSKGGVDTKGAYYMWRSLKLCCDEEIFPILDSTSAREMIIQ